MFKNPPNALILLLVGKDARMQAYVAMTVVAIVIYTVCMATQCVWARSGRASPTYAAALISVVALGQSLFYAMQRSGWSKRFADRGLTMAQMVFALLCLGASYLINPPVRGTVLMIVTLVLVFGAFTVKPSCCRALGWLAVAIFGTAMYAGATFASQDFTPAVEWVNFVLTVTILPLMAHLAGRLSKLRHRQRLQQKELRAALERLNLLATRDALTGLPNRRCMLDRLEQEIPRLRRHNSPLCIAILDLDHFKAVNDRYGHSVGDQALVNFAREAQTVLREADALARWGGEEFLLMLPDTPPELALRVLERLHKHVRDPSNWLHCPTAKVTFSAGLAVHVPAEEFEQTLERADRALYEAKRTGRDRCVEAAPASANTRPMQLTLLEQDP